MSAAKYTPGPWGHAWGGGHALIYPVDGGPTIAGVPYDTDNQIPLVEANARLIAAAPDLLEALRALDSYVCNELSSDYPTGIDVDGPAFMAARAAIAKATGSEA